MSVCREKCPLISWLENMKRQIFKSVFLWTEVCPCYRLNLNMIRQRWKSIIIWNIIYSEDAPPYISALPAEAGMWARASQFPPDYNDGGSYLFSPAVRLYSFFFSLSLFHGRNCSFYWWQAIWKCPCWIVTGAMLFESSRLAQQIAEVIFIIFLFFFQRAGRERTQKSIQNEMLFYVAISKLEF